MTASQIPASHGPQPLANVPVSQLDGRALKGAATRERIIISATKIFGTRSYDDARLADIAKNAGVTDAGLLHHFSSKLELFMSVADKRDEIYGAIGENLTTARELFDRLIASVQRAAEDPDLLLFRVMLTGAARLEGHPAHDRIRNGLRYGLDRVAPFVQGRIDAGELRPELNGQQIVLELLALNEGIRDQWATLPDRIDYVAVFTTAANSLYDRVRAVGTSS